MTWLRSSYEARVLVVPFGMSGSRVVDHCRSADLDGLMVLHQDITSIPGDSTRSVELSPLTENGWSGTPRTRGTMRDVIGQADMTVLVAADLAEVPDGSPAAVAAEVRAHGGLLAAVVVGEEIHWESPRGSRALVDLREAVDMVVMLRASRLVAAFLDVLRGGERAPVT